MPLNNTEFLRTVLTVEGLAAYKSAMDDAGKANRGLLGTLGGALAGGGIVAGLQKVVNAAADLEQTRIAFEGLTGSAEKANQHIQALQDLDKKSALGLTELLRGSQLLQNYGASAEQAVTIQQALGNAIAASGRDSETFSRAVLAAGQIIGRGVLQGDELNQLAEAGVPVQEVLKELGATSEDVGRQGITAERAMAALIKVLNSGRFASAAERQAKTFKGQLNALDSESIKLAQTMGNILLPTLTGLVKGLNDLLTQFNALPEPTKQIAGIAAGVLVSGLGLAMLAMKALEAQAKLLEIQHYKTARAAGVHAGAEAGFGSVPVGGGGGMGGGVSAGGGTPKGSGWKGAAKGLGKGLLGFLGFEAGNALLGFLPDEGIGKDVKKHGGRALGGAAIGGTLGSFIPGVGTVAGGLLGGAIGVGGGMLADSMAKPEPATTKPTDPLTQQNALLQAQLDVAKAQLAKLEGLSRGDTFNNGVASGAYAAMAGMNRRIIA